MNKREVIKMLNENELIKAALDMVKDEQEKKALRDLAEKIALDIYSAIAPAADVVKTQSAKK